MSKEAKRALERLSKNVKDNSPRIERKLTKVGVNPDPALVYSTAKYYRALNKLAKA